jgi:thiamine-monophosphate kinase
MARASGVRAVVEPAALPLAEGMAEVAAAAGRDPRRLAAAGGEDYELLAALPPGDVEAARRAAPCPLTPVGRAEEGPPALAGLEAGGWEHDV